MTTVIANPIINSPFRAPTRHFQFADDGITNDIVESRRRSSYFIPIPAPKKKAKQLELGTEWTLDRIKENEFINRIRDRVSVWREAGYPGVTTTEKDKEAKVTTAKTLWIPAINNHGGFGRRAFLEVKDPWDAKNLIRAKIDGARVRALGRTSPPCPLSWTQERGRRAERGREHGAV